MSGQMVALGRDSVQFYLPYKNPLHAKKKNPKGFFHTTSKKDLGILKSRLVSKFSSRGHVVEEVKSL